MSSASTLVDESVAPNPKAIRDIIFVHGAWADGSTWAKLIPLFEGKGLNLVALQLPMTSLEADLAVAQRAIDDAEGPILLIAHSFGGIVATEAGVDPKVAGLLYIAAGAPDVGESFADLVKPYPPSPALGEARKTSDGFYHVSAKGMAEDVAPDVPAIESYIMAVTQGPFSEQAFTDRVAHAAWKTKPTWYIIASDDRVIPIELERWLANRMKATAVTVSSGHCVMLSHPTEVYALVASALQVLADR